MFGTVSRSGNVAKVHKTAFASALLAAFFDNEGGFGYKWEIGGGGWGRVEIVWIIFAKQKVINQTSFKKVLFESLNFAEHDKSKHLDEI